MATQLYDEQLQNKIKNWTQDTATTILTPQQSRELFQIQQNQTNDNPIKLPLVQIRKSGGYTITDASKQVRTFDGFSLKVNSGNTLQLNQVPIEIPYQIDVYSRYYDEADEYIRNLVFNIINFPRLEIDIPYNGEHYMHEQNLVLGENVSDNSDVPERIFHDQFTRLSLDITVKDAYLFDIRYRKNWTLETEVIINNN